LLPVAHANCEVVVRTSFDKAGDEARSRNGRESVEPILEVRTDRTILPENRLATTCISRHEE
jgi:hypothetical protein